MKISTLLDRFGRTREQQSKAVFSTIFIAGNRLQTAFDRMDTDVTLKQFMLLTMVRQAGEPMTFTQFGNLLGCSRQNIKKLAAALEQKGFVEIRPNASDIRAATILPTGRLEAYFGQMAALHQQKLALLFADYSDSELDLLFRLLPKLYQGIERLERELI